MAPTTNTTPSSTNSTAPVRLAGAGPRRWRWIALGLGLITTGALGVMGAWSQADQREGVVVAARDLAAGHTLTTEDLAVAQVAAEEQVVTVPSQDLHQVVGQTLEVPLDEGMLLAETTLAGPGEYPDADAAIVGAALEPSQYPASLEPGAHVAVIAAAGAEPGEPTEQDEGQAGPDTVTAEVQSLTPAENGAATLVELAVEAADAEVVARAATAGEVTLVATAPEDS